MSLITTKKVLQNFEFCNSPKKSFGKKRGVPSSPYRLRRDKLSCYVKREQFVVKKWLILKNVILCNKGDNIVAYISQTVIH